MLENRSFYANLSSHFGVIRASGEEAATFLQGQLSNDIRLVTPELAQYSTYSTPKGRMLANFLIWQADDAYFLLCRLDLLEPTLKRLKMYVMRSKVTLGIENEWNKKLLVHGIFLPNAEMQKFGLDQPACSVKQDSEQLLKFPNENFYISLGNDFGLLVNIDGVRSSGSNPVRPIVFGEKMIGDELVHGVELPREIREIDAQSWQWVHIAAGVPWISAATVEAFVPQMANMDALGAIHFKKGCYTGQEVVARLHYLGKSKRRLYRIGLADEVALVEGADLYGRDGETSVKVGQIVNIAPDLTQKFGQQALAVIQIAAWETGIFTDAALTQAVTVLPLPYEVKE